jgi:hypothetical protein
MRTHRQFPSETALIRGVGEKKLKNFRPTRHTPRDQNQTARGNNMSACADNTTARLNNLTARRTPHTPASPR